MAPLRGTEADRVLAGEVGYHSHEVRLRGQPAFVFVAHLVSRSVSPYHEPVSQRRGSPAVAGVRWERPLEVALVEDPWNSAGGGHHAKALELDDALPQLREDPGCPGRQLGAASAEAGGWADDRPAAAHVREGRGEVLFDDGDDPIKVRIAPVCVLRALWRALRRDAQGVGTSAAYRRLPAAAAPKFVVSKEEKPISVTGQIIRSQPVLKDEWHPRSLSLRSSALCAASRGRVSGGVGRGKAASRGPGCTGAEAQRRRRKLGGSRFGEEKGQRPSVPSEARPRRRDMLKRCQRVLGETHSWRAGVRIVRVSSAATPKGRLEARPCRARPGGPEGARSAGSFGPLRLLVT